MAAILNIAGSLQMHSQFFKEPESSPLSERFTVVGIVVLLHLSFFASYLLQPEAPAVLVNEMSISFANMQMPQAEVIPQPKPKLREPDPVPSEEPAVKEVQPVQQAATPPSPVVLDAEPDYKADYLNNPKPAYPLAAIRMGYQGKVILDIEVLSNGNVGEIKVHQSSGYAILDNAALQTIKKTWHFTPARHLGQPVTKWYLLPIPFTIKEND